MKYRSVEEYLNDWPDGVSGGKGDASRQEQAAADQQRAMENQLTQQQLQLQMGQLAQVNPTLQSIISGQGFLPGQQEAFDSIWNNTQSALTSQLMNGLPQQFRNIQGQINNSLVARGITGGDNAGSGDIARNFGQLGAMQAALQQQGLSNIALQGAGFQSDVQRLKMQNLQQALGTSLGVSSQYGANVGGFNASSLGALDAGVNAAKNVDASQGGFMGSLLGAIGTVGGAALGGPLGAKLGGSVGQAAGGKAGQFGGG